MGTYSFAGRTLRSHISLPELLPIAGTRSPWCSVDMLSNQPIDDAIHAVDGTPFAFRRRPESVLLRFDGVADFAISTNWDHVAVHRLAGAPDAQIRHVLIDQVLPRILDAHGILTVHASGVVVDGAAVLFLGQSGYGKSSLAASLSDQFTVLGDDCFLLEASDSGVVARSTYRSLRLNPDSTTALLPTAPIPPGQSLVLPKTQMVKPAANDQEGPVSVRALFILDTDHDELHPVSVKPLSARDAAVHVVRNSFRMDIHGATSLASAFDRAEEVVERCAIYRLSYPHDYDVLPKVHRAILAAL